MSQYNCAEKSEWREVIGPSDVSQIRGLCQAAGNFSYQEVEVATEVAIDGLQKGPSSGYFFVFAEQHRDLLAFACYGPIACTAYSWDIYWIVVHPKNQGKGTGGLLLAEVERRIAEAGGQKIYVDTSSRNDYRPARGLYEKHGYQLEATLNDFYYPGDAKMIYCKAVTP